MFRAYPRHSVELTGQDYQAIFSFLGSLGKGKENFVEAFEKSFADYIGTRHALAMPSARLGLYVLLSYFHFPEGTEVIITPFTHQSVFTIIKSCRLNPVFVDIDEQTCNTNPDLVEEKITSRTKLMILTHMWGQPCEMDAFMGLKKKYGLIVIEDCAMACGATYKGQKVGSFGDASIFSFGKAKAICAFGGGMVCTSDNKIMESTRSFSDAFTPAKKGAVAVSVINTIIANWLTRPFTFSISIYGLMRLFNLRDPYNPIEHKKDSLEILEKIPPEWKVRLSPLQAAVGEQQLQSLDRRNAIKIEHARILNEELKDIPDFQLPLSSQEVVHIYLYYAIYIKKSMDLNDLRKRLLHLSVDTQLNELTTPQQLSIFGANSQDFPVFHKVSGNLLIVPNGFYLKEHDVQAIAQALRKAMLEMKG